jgi:hypothetical protein
VQAVITRRFVAPSAELIALNLLQFQTALLEWLLTELPRFLKMRFEIADQTARHKIDRENVAGSRSAVVPE